MKEVPYDLYCPKVQEKIKERMCPKCGIYFPSKAAKTRHGKAHDLILVPKPYWAEEDYNSDGEEVEETNESVATNTCERIPVITNMLEFLRYNPRGKNWT